MAPKSHQVGPERTKTDRSRALDGGDMTHRPLLRFTLSIVLLAAGLVSNDAEPAATAAPAATDAVIFNDLPAEIEAMAVWAIGLFDSADMALPPLQINHYGTDTSHCDGHDGLHRPGDGRSVIELCTDDVSFPTQAMVIHELSHAWVDDNVGIVARRAFQELRGYEFWRNYDEAAWHENGTEQAAEIIAWGLFDRPMDMIRITQNSCDDLEIGYHTLTGRAPLHGYRDLCDA